MCVHTPHAWSHTRYVQRRAPLPHPITPYARAGGAIRCVTASASSNSTGSAPCLKRQHNRSPRWNASIPLGYRRTQAAASRCVSLGRKNCRTGQARRTTPSSQCDPLRSTYFFKCNKDALSVGNSSCVCASLARVNPQKRVTSRAEGATRNRHQLGSSTIARVRVGYTHIGSDTVLFVIGASAPYRAHARKSTQLR